MMRKRSCSTAAVQVESIRDNELSQMCNVTRTGRVTCHRSGFTAGRTGKAITGSPFLDFDERRADHEAADGLLPGKDASDR